MSYVALVLLIVGLLWLMLVYNRLVQLRNQVTQAWADIDVQLQRRYDLVPQLVAAVKGYVSHESDTLTNVTKLRSQAEQTQGAAQRGAAEKQLAASLISVVALKESYPDLKASDNFIQLSNSLVDVENKLQYARRFYNGAVRDLNTKVQEVPDVLIAKLFGFDEAEFFQADSTTHVVPKVDITP